MEGSVMVDTTDFGNVVRRADGSYVINGGMYHVPNDGDFAELWSQVDTYATEYPDNVTDDVVHTPTTDELFDRLRSFRDARINSVLWMRERHADELELGKETTLTPEQYAALLTYIQALRDIPAQPGAPWDGGGELTPWPELPNF